MQDRTGCTRTIGLAASLLTFAVGLACSFIVSMFVCWNTTRKTVLRLLCWEGSKHPGSDHTPAEPQRHKPRADQRQRYKPRTCQSMLNTLQVDRLARIPGYDTYHTCRILSHWTASPHALYDILFLDGGRGKTMHDLVDRDRELLPNKAKLNKAKLNKSNSD